MTQLNHRYQLHDTLGAGGMGEVFRATDRLTGQTVALKRVLRLPETVGSTADGDLRLALAHEFQLLATLRHPFIIEVIDYGFDEDSLPYFTMTYLAQPQDLLEAARPLPLPQQVSMVVAVLQALVYLHRRGILHRDLKPSNILVTQGQVKVVNFGVSVAREQAEGLVGTVAYMSPEVLRGDRQTEQSDLYAIGVMLYELLEGHHPFSTDGSLVELIQDIIHLKPEFTATDDPFCAAVQQVAACLMAKDPRQRYPDARATIRALCTAADLPTPPESEATREAFLQGAAFIGREAEYAHLHDALHSLLKTQQGAAWLIGGENGVGKSRLVNEVATAARVKGVLVLEGQGVAQGGYPFHLWREPLRRVLLVQGANPTEAAILKPIVPDIEALLGQAVADAPPLPNERANQERLIGAMLDVLTRIASPTLVLLEDYQWGRESRVVMERLLPVLAQLPVLVIITYRTEDEPSLPETLPASRHLKLERLDPAAIAALTTAMLGQHVPDMVAVLQRETEGNVFFLVEVMRVLAQEAGSLEGVAVKTIPASLMAGGVERVLQRRLQRLDQRYWPMLQLAAIWGRQIDLKLMAQVCPPATPLEAWLRACDDAAILEVYEAAWRFNHDKLREFILNHLDDPPALYRQAAQVYAAVYPNQPSAAPILADYWAKANDPSQEVIYREQAVHYANDMADFEGVLAHAQRWLDLLGPDDDLARAKAYQELSGGRRMMGDYESAYAFLDEAERHAQAIHDVEQLAWIALRRAQFTSLIGQPVQALEMAQQALSAAEAHGLIQQMTDATKQIGWANFKLGRYAEAREWLQKALDLAESHPHLVGVSLRADILNDIAGAYWATGEYATCEAYVVQCIVLRRESYAPVALSTALSNLARLRLALGNYDAAAEAIQESLDLTRPISGVLLYAAKLSVLALAEYLRGNLAAAREASTQALALFDEVYGSTSETHETHHIEALTYHLLIRTLQGDWEGLDDLKAAIIRKALQAHLVTTYAPLLLALAVLAYYRDADAAQALTWLTVIDADPTTQAATQALLPPHFRENLQAALTPTEYTNVQQRATLTVVEAELRRLE